MPEEIQQVDPAVWEQLKKCELFAALSPDESADFLNQYGKSRGMRVQEFHKGQLICTKGQYELDLCIILKGAVEFQDNIPGQGYIPVGRRLAPDFYGEAGAMGELPRSSHVVALEDSRIFYLPASALRSVAQNAAARQKLEQRYKESIIRILAAEIEIFQGVPPAFIEQLIPQLRDPALYRRRRTHAPRRRC